MTVLLAMVAVVLLVVAAVVGSDNPSPWLRGVYVLAMWAGPALVVFTAWRVFGGRVVDRVRTVLRGITGPSVIQQLPPRSVLNTTLQPVYGDRPLDGELLTALLGGAGRDPAKGDTAVSRSTSAIFRLEAIDDSFCRVEVTWTHDYSAIRDNYMFVVFATSDTALAGTLVSERRLPLFELWVLDEETFEEFVPTLRESTSFGITYTDTDGMLREVAPTPMHGREVVLAEFDRYVRLPDHVDRHSVRIVSFDLFDLAHDDHVVDSIRTMSMRTTFRGSIDQRYTTWSPPHPCFVESVVFDVTGLPRGGERFTYLVLASTIKKAGLVLSGGWQEFADLITVDVRAWMLPGHGITLLWRPHDEG